MLHKNHQKFTTPVQSRIKDANEFRERIKAAWEDLDQRIIDTAVQQWRTHLHACVKAKGNHFEHKFPWLNDETPHKLFNRSILTIVFFIMISEFLIKCVVNHIVHDIHDKTELVTHCFSPNCDSTMWNLRCMWCSISWYASCWNLIKFCCLQWKLYTKNLGGPSIMAHRVVYSLGIGMGMG